ncbi:MAG: GAF domain-containing protein [Actinobacteria bacterium]|nr:GAF domain-containing protein [Actinomycetota bacterium]
MGDALYTGGGVFGGDEDTVVDAVEQAVGDVGGDFVADVADEQGDGELGLRFYAAAPLITVDGYRLGTVNVTDRQLRQITEDDVQTLRDLAAMVVDELELRLAAVRTVKSERQLRNQAQRVARMLKQAILPAHLPAIPGWKSGPTIVPPRRRTLVGTSMTCFPSMTAVGVSLSATCAVRVLRQRV